MTRISSFPRSIYTIPVANNVCNQTLREIYKLPNVSVAHVSMMPDAVSLLHEHHNTHEGYFIIEGQGTLSVRDKDFEVRTHDYIPIPPHVPHKMKNTGLTKLEHLVIATPPFDSNDVFLLEEPSIAQIRGFLPERKAPISSADGAQIIELDSAEERAITKKGLALGTLAIGNKSIPHLHEETDELYHVLHGRGWLHLGKLQYPIRSDSVMDVPRGIIHSLENSGQEPLQVLCISSPPYSERDFIKSED